MFRRHNTGTRIFSNFVKILGAGPSPRQRQRNLLSLPDQRNRTNILDAGFKGEMYNEKKYPLDRNLTYFLVEFTFIFFPLAI